MVDYHSRLDVMFMLKYGHQSAGNHELWPSLTRLGTDMVSYKHHDRDITPTHYSNLYRGLYMASLSPKQWRFRFFKMVHLGLIVCWYAHIKMVLYSLSMTNWSGYFETIMLLFLVLFPQLLCAHCTITIEMSWTQEYILWYMTYGVLTHFNPRGGLA